MLAVGSSIDDTSFLET